MSAIDKLAPIIADAIQQSREEQDAWQKQHDAEIQAQQEREQQFWSDYHAGLYPEPQEIV